MKSALLLALSTLAFSTVSFAAQDCRAIFDSGYSAEVKVLLAGKFNLVDEKQIENPAEIPFRISVQDDLDVDPETLTLSLSLAGTTILVEKRDSKSFAENGVRTNEWLKNLPSCSEVYSTRHE